MRKYLLPFFLLSLDILSILFVAFFSLYLRFDNVLDNPYSLIVVHLLPAIVVAYVLPLLIFRLYTRMWRYLGLHEIKDIILASSLGVAFFWCIVSAFGYILPRSYFLISYILIVGVICFERVILHYIILREMRHMLAASSTAHFPVLIIGAGDAGNMLARELAYYHSGNREVSGFIDDDPNKQGMFIQGKKVLGTRSDISRIVNENNIREIIIAMPSAKTKTIREITDVCVREKQCKLTILPGIYQFLNGDISVSNLRPVSVEDLLEREPVQLDFKKIAAYLENKRVLVTGAGGSIGSEICRQIMRMNPQQLILAGHGENSIYLIYQELSKLYGKNRLIPAIISIRDKEELRRLFEEHRPQVVFHAAAHKHVPLMERQPRAAISNNVYGTRNVAVVAGEYGVEKFVMISTDKAVNPTSVMGATKQVAEKVIRVMNGHYKTEYVTVRFGNVLGSRGSVVPLFKKQIAAGGPVTVTHPEMTRYFMTIPEASQLVLEAGAIGKGGALFLLDMGEPVKIMDLAKNMIRLSGYEEGKDIEIKITGLRPGEKLYEELLTKEEGVEKTQYEKIYEAPLEEVNGKWLFEKIESFGQCNTGEDIIHVLQEIIPTYNPNHTPDNRNLLQNFEEIDVGNR
ncbi:polysaccharide biosynthesis protein [Megasphaera vaginalis (ex Bordigoni et al. 2020)]|uniref:polysaccharide biosynthesis protein n=1 Tax=Megasphaera vaginalis (ex Bordigoni et al. 2020) TaxID=2045301 RepID=UPI000C7CE524|nr:nucleoside-diphosphate sugar epimerase/dehydratase [Megasphaera vaginalis (ex Bordigoni et al. 2020)]